MLHSFDLSGQRILVTGAAGALGGATVQTFAGMGADLVLTDLTAPEALAEGLRGKGLNVTAHALDNTDRAAVAAFAGDLGKIDAYAECSGIYKQGQWLDDEGWDDLLDRTLNVNLRGPMNLMREIMPRMMTQGHGRIAILTSMAARNAGTTLSVEPAYVASKGAIQAMVHYFARQAAPHGVIVNAVAPGPIETPMTTSSKQPFDLEKLPTRRFGQPSEVGGPMAFLCSPAAGYMTGVVIDVNGGLHFS